MQLIFIILAFAPFIYGKLYVDTSTQFITDSYNRSLFFHGVNAVYKKFPFYPNITTFSPLTSLCEEDFQNLQTWGFNLIRLYASWEGIESIKGQYNQTLIAELKAIVELAAKYNIYILLDAHQDVANRKFCGEGFPDWAVSSTEKFPEPIENPDKMDINKTSQYPNLTECLKKTFALYYSTYGVSSAFQNLYTNVDNLTDHFAGMWKTVASTFKSYENVLGYEILNEPWFGDIFKDKGLIINSDTKLLQPFYTKVAQQIREVDNDTIVFFEPNVMEEVAIDMKSTPLGKQYHSKEVFSFHLYCGFQDRESIERDACDAIIDGRFDISYKKGKELGAGMFVTEFGAKQDDDQDVMQLNYTISKAEDNFLSWAYWQFKQYDDYTTQLTGATESLYFSNGTLQENKLKILCRSYFYAICGTPKKTGFDAALYSQNNGGTLYLEFYPDNCSPKHTEFYLSEYYYYPNGFSFKSEGCTGISYQKIKENYYELIVPTNCIGKLVKVTIEQKQSVTQIE